MGLLDTLKSALGFDSSRDKEPDASSERAVKEPAAADTSASGSTGSITEEPPETPGDDEVAEAAEPAEAAGPESQVEEPEPAAADEEVETVEPDESEEGEPVDSISGIGPAYAARLSEAGIDSVADLAAADADALADETGVSAKRLGRWIDRAKEY